jgi:RHS repeat-associated protein
MDFALGINYASRDVGVAGASSASTRRSSTPMRANAFCVFVGIAISVPLSAANQQPGLRQANLFANQAPVTVAQKLVFSQQPTDTEILYAGLFPEPLVPAGGSTDPEQNRALGTALMEYSHAAHPDQLDPIISFIRRYPKSPWDTALLLNVGIIYRKTGHLSEALSSWQSAWVGSAEFKDPTGKALGDAALGKLALFYAYLGRTQELGALMESVHGRSLTGAATENMANAAEGLAMMQKMPAVSFRCGPLALARICRSQRKTDAAIVMETATSTSKGTSLVQLLELTKKAGLDYQMAYRNPGSEVIVPAVINWKVGHYAAILSAGNEFRVGDSTFGEDIWMRQATLDEESSGYFLVSAGPLPPGWRSVPPTEGEAVWGRGNTGGNAPPGPGPCDPQAFSQCGGACEGGGAGGGDGAGGAGGMTTYNVDAMPDSLELYDRVLRYTPPIGRPMNFALSYMHRDDVQPPVFTYTNFGPKWTSNWISYVTDNTTFDGGTADLYLPGGGLESYVNSRFNGNQILSPGPKTQAQMTKIMSGNTVLGFKRSLSDGSIQLFQSWLAANQYFLSAVYDPQGNGISLNYNGTRLISITDVSGHAMTLTYGLSTDPLKVTAVTDPFGRTANFTYSADGHLTSITDPMGITSSYTWSINDFISQLTTPYGTTKFAYLDGYLGPTYDSNPNPNIAPACCFSRSLTITDPLGLTSRVDYVQNAPGLQDADPQNSVPQVIGTQNSNLEWRNAFVWNPSQLALATNPDGTLDYTKAHIMHFLHLNGTSAAPVLESEKYPLENRVWYTYPGQPAGNMAGLSNQPIAIGRVLDDGTTQLTTFQRNSIGRITQLTDPVGRQFTFSYDTNGIDLLSETATTGGAHSVLFSATYNSQHEPLTFSEADGETTTLSYNTAGQPLSLKNPLGQITAYTYDPSGFLTAIDRQPTIHPPLWQSARIVSFTHDAYGRVQTITNELGYTETISYDLANRPTAIAFPDGTTDKFGYQFLDLVSLTDRMNRTTSFQYDADRRQVAIKDPLGLSTQFSYCACGVISAIKDPAGNTTSFNFDLQDRITSRQYPDGSKALYTYELTTSRLNSLTNANGLGATYAYNADNTLSAILSGPQPGAVPFVTFTYDRVIRRLVIMKDTFGTTEYGYYPDSSGTPLRGGGQLASERGPYGDIVSYKYDALGRAISRSIGRGTPVTIPPIPRTGQSETLTFDNLGRISSVTNVLGTFSYTYLGASRRISAISSAHGPNEIVTYYDVNEDNLVKQISWTVVPPHFPSPHPARVLLASFNYGYDADDEITQITFGGSHVNFPSGLGASTSATSYRLNYDADSELLGVTPVGNAPGANYAYSYSSAFNMLSSQTGNTTTNFSYNNLNQLTTPETSYDGDGNLTALGQTRFEWIPAASSRPVDLSQADWNLMYIHNSNGSTTQFRYDGLGRRTEIIEGGNGGIVSDKRYVWCGFRICQEHDMMAASASLPGGPVTKNYFNQGVQINGSPYYYTLDGQGSVIHLVNSQGGVAAQYQYDPYGNQVSILGPPSDVGFTGLFEHQPSGLALAVFREYSPSIGRWLSRDPIGEFATITRRPRVPMMSLYTYATNDPLNFRDPSGLDPSGFWQAWAARAFAVWSWATGGTESSTGAPPADYPAGQSPSGGDPAPGPTNPGGGPGGGSGPGPGTGSGGSGAGPGFGGVQNVGGWFTWVPGSFCTPMIFPGHCFFYPDDPSCGGGG